MAEHIKFILELLVSGLSIFFVLYKINKISNEIKESEEKIKKLEKKQNDDRREITAKLDDICKILIKGKS